MRDVGSDRTSLRIMLVHNAFRHADPRQPFVANTVAALVYAFLWGSVGRAGARPLAPEDFADED